MGKVNIVFKDSTSVIIEKFVKFANVAGVELQTPIHQNAVIVIEGENAKVHVQSSDIHHVEIF